MSENLLLRIIQNPNESLIGVLWSIFKVRPWVVTGLFSTMGAVNAAGLVWGIPTQIRQILDPRFFTNHVASISISIAFAIISWRGSYILLAEMCKLIVTMVMSNGDRSKREEVVNFFEVVFHIFSFAIGCIVFLESHLGIFPAGDFFVVSLLGVICFVVWRLFKKFIINALWAVESDGENGFPLLVNRVAENLGNTLYRNTPFNILVLLVLGFSFTCGWSRLNYLKGEAPTDLVFSRIDLRGDEVSTLMNSVALLGSTGSGVVVFHRSEEAAGRRSNRFEFIPYDAIESLRFSEY